MLNYLEYLVPRELNDGVIYLACGKGKVWQQKPFTDLNDANNFIDENKNNYNIYCNNAVFSDATSRRKENIAVIDSLYADIDDHTSADFSKYDALMIERELSKHYETTIPTPHLVIFTGRGLQLRFKLRDCYSLGLWQMAQDDLQRRLQKIINGIDTLCEVDGIKDPNRFLRVPHTINQANGAQTDYLVVNKHIQPYKLDNLIAFYDFKAHDGAPLKDAIKDGSRHDDNVKYLLKHTATPKERKPYRNTNKGMTIITLANSIMHDLRLLQEYDNKRGYTEGRRHKMTAIYASKVIDAMRYENLKPLETISAMIHGFNEGFSVPLDDKEVDAIITSILRKKTAYAYKKATIMETLGMSGYESDEFKALVPKKVINKRYQDSHKDLERARCREKRKRKYYEHTKQYNDMRKDNYKKLCYDLYKQGATLKEIAIKLKEVYKIDKSLMTISRYIKAVKKELEN